jgi:hypothetical protein
MKEMMIGRHGNPTATWNGRHARAECPALARPGAAARALPSFGPPFLLISGESDGNNMPCLRVG